MFNTYMLKDVIKSIGILYLKANDSNFQLEMWY